jgi:DNA transformation protein
MAVSRSFKTFVEEQLDDPRRVTTRAMFGGLGIYWDGAFFALIDDDTLFFKVDDVSRPEFERHGSKPFDPFKNGQVMRGYYEVPGEVLEDRDRLADWRERAVSVARSAKRKKRGTNR